MRRKLPPDCAHPRTDTPFGSLFRTKLGWTRKACSRLPGEESGPVFSRALELYRRAAEKEPENPDVHTSLGFMMAQVGEFDGAIASFRRALALDPRAPLTGGGLGDAYISVKRFDEAIDVFLKMVELQRNDGFAHYRLARALETAGRAGEAEEAFERARRLGYSRQ